MHLADRILKFENPYELYTVCAVRIFGCYASVIDPLNYIYMLARGHTTTVDSRIRLLKIDSEESETIVYSDWRSVSTVYNLYRCV